MTLPPLPSSPSSSPTPAPLPSSATPLTPAAAPPSPPVSFPITWLLEHASAPIKFRSVTEVAKPPGAITDQIASLPFTYEPALTLAVMQQADGTWNHAMLSIPSSRGEHFDGIGTITAVRRLLEYGWDKDTPPLTHARRILFRLLAEETAHS